MESATNLRNIKISPKKLRFLLPVVKKMSPVDAIASLLYIPKRSARILNKAIKSAISNAKLSLKVSEDMLQFKTLKVDEGYVLKRYNAGSKGTANPFKRRSAHITIVLQAKPAIKLAPKIETAETKKSVETKVTEKEAVKKKNVAPKSKSKVAKAEK